MKKWYVCLFLAVFGGVVLSGCASKPESETRTIRQGPVVEERYIVR